MQSYFLRFILLTAWLIGAGAATAETTVRLGLLGAGPEVFAYEISVLKLAVEHSGQDAVLEVEVLEMPQERAFLELETGRAPFNVFFSGFSRERESRFRQIDIPLTRGLLGHRIFITNMTTAPLLKGITSLEDFKEMSVIGSGNGWPDTRIFEAAGFNVEKSRYENLWQMLAKGRINTFNRGIHEAYVEIKLRRQQHANLLVDPYLMVRYPFDYMIYVRKGDDKIGDLLENGLKNAYENGAFMKNFNAHPMIREVVLDANPEGRLVFDIDNPLMTERQRAIPSKYWHSFADNTEGNDGVKEARNGH